MANAANASQKSFFSRMGAWFVNLPKRIGKAFSGMWHELKKVSWPTRKQLLNYTVLVLIFMAEALPMTILYLRDNNTLVYTFKYTLSLGVIQSLSSAIGIVLTVIFATLASSVFLKK